MSRFCSRATRGKGLNLTREPAHLLALRPRRNPARSISKLSIGFPWVLQERGGNAKIYNVTGRIPPTERQRQEAGASSTLFRSAAMSNGIRSSWCPIKSAPHPPSRVGRSTTLARGR